MDSLKVIGPNTAAQTRQAIARDAQLARQRVVNDWEQIQRQQRRNKPTTDICVHCGAPFSDSPRCCDVG